MRRIIHSLSIMSSPCWRSRPPKLLVLAEHINTSSCVGTKVCLYEPRHVMYTSSCVQTGIASLPERLIIISSHASDLHLPFEITFSLSRFQIFMASGRHNPKHASKLHFLNQFGLANHVKTFSWRHICIITYMRLNYESHLKVFWWKCQKYRNPSPFLTKKCHFKQNYFDKITCSYFDDF